MGFLNKVKRAANFVSFGAIDRHTANKIVKSAKLIHPAPYHR